MALAAGEQMDYGFVRDEDRRLVVVASGDQMSQGFARDADGRLVIAGSPDWSSGDNVTIYSANPEARTLAIKDGTSAEPVTEAHPTFKVSRTSGVTGGITGDGAPELAAIYGSSSGTAASKVQEIGVMGSAKNAGTEGEPDAAGMYAVGRIVVGGKGRAFGGFFAGRRDGAEQRATGLEVYVENGGGADSYDATTEAETTKGVYIHAGTAKIACGVQITVLSGESPSVDVGFAINKFAAATAGYQDNSSAERSIQIKGAHAKGAITVAAGSGGVVIGAESSSFLESSGSLLDVLSASSSLSTAAVVRNSGANNVALQVSNSKGDLRLATAGGAGGFWTGSAEGDSGLLGNASKTIHIGRAGGVRAPLRVSNNVGIGSGSADSFGGGVGVIFIANRTTKPESNPSGGGVLYTEEGKLMYRGSSGTVKELAAA